MLKISIILVIIMFLISALYLYIKNEGENMINNVRYKDVDCESSIDPFAEKRDLWNSRLDSASEWLITDGLKYYDENGEKEFNRKLGMELLVLPYFPSFIEKTDPYISFGITLGGSFFDIKSFYREENEDSIYEIWAVFSTFDPISCADNKVTFYYTKTSGFYNFRTIESKEKKFKPSFEFDDGFLFEIPLDKDHVNERIIKTIEKYMKY